MSLAVVKVHLLGWTPVVLDDESYTLPGDKRGAVLAYLACQVDWTSREKLALLFWPDTDDSSARRNLRQLLNRIKAQPFARTLELTSTHVRWPVESDVARYRTCLAQGDAAAAVALYRGPLFADFAPDEFGGFGAWLELERENLARSFGRAVMTHVVALESTARYEEASNLLERLLDENPLAEDVMQRYLRVLYLSGQRDAALAAYERYSRRLNEELALEPLEATQGLAATIRRALPLAASPPNPVRPLVPVSMLRPPRLVGRDATRHQVLTATTPLVLVSGEPGIGKTRFLQDLLPGASWCACREGLESVPYYPLLEFIRHHLDRLPDLGSYREDLARLVPEVAPELTPAPLEPHTAKARLLEAIARALEPFAPLVFDDLQWADPATLEALVVLSNRPAARHYGALRSGEEGAPLRTALASLQTRDLVTTVSLDALAESDLQALLADLMGIETGPRLFSHWLHARSSGNPMFALETLKALFESGVLRLDSQGWHTDLDEITRDYSEIEVPPVVTGVILRRLGMLPDSAVRVLQAAAVVQERLGADLLASIAGLSAWAVVEALEDAENAAIVTAEGFRHDLLRQAIYQALPERRRRLLHARAAEALEGDAEAVRVAEHWLAAGVPAKAGRAWLDAAKALGEQGLALEAIDLLNRTMPHAPEEQHLELHLELARYHVRATAYEQARALLDELMDAPQLATRLDAHDIMADLLLSQGDVGAAAWVTARGLELAGTQDVAPARRLKVMQAKVLYLQHDYGGALAILEPELELAREQAPGHETATLTTDVAQTLDNLGRHREALTLHLEAIAIAKRAGARYAQVYAATNLLHCCNLLGELEHGLGEAEAASRLGPYDLTETLHNNLSSAYLALGRFDEAASQARRLIEGTSNPHFLGVSWARLAIIHRQTGEDAQADAALAESIATLDAMQLDSAKANVIRTVLQHGHGQLVAQVTPHLAHLDAAKLRAGLKEELERLLQARSA